VLKAEALASPHLQLPIAELLFVRQKRLEIRPIHRAGQPNATRANVTPCVANLRVTAPIDQRTGLAYSQFS
jgi:hypothetical protein